MFKSIRQSMAWLHTHIGLYFGWFMFIIFLMGSLSYYKNEINIWAEPQIAHYQTEQTTAIKSAYQYLQENGENAKEWHIKLAQPQVQPANLVYWFNDEEYNKSTLHPETGEDILLDNEFALGDFFYQFHFQLYGLPIKATQLWISFVAFILLLTLISGIITHKKILTDFFTLRTFKSQRTWLDIHNLTAVSALPFFIIMCFTGLAILFYVYFPQSIQHFYPKSTDYFREIREHTSTLNVQNPQPAQMQELDIFLQHVQQHWGDAPIARISVIAPQQSHAVIRFEQRKDHTLTLNPARLEFNAITGELLENSRNRSPLAQINAGIYALHLAPFSSSLLRLCLFISGLLGCMMIGAGLLLWSIKRQIKYQQQNETLGQFFVDRFNTATLVGLPMAVIASFYAVRLDAIIRAVGLNDFFGFNFITCFLFLWLFSFVISLLTPKIRLWGSQLIVLSILCLTLPMVNLIYLIQQDIVNSIHQYWLFLRIDIWMILLGILSILMIKYIKPIQIYPAKTLEITEQSPISHDKNGV